MRKLSLLLFLQFMFLINLSFAQSKFDKIFIDENTILIGNIVSETNKFITFFDEEQGKELTLVKTNLFKIIKIDGTIENYNSSGKNNAFSSSEEDNNDLRVKYKDIPYGFIKTNFQLNFKKSKDKKETISKVISHEKGFMNKKYSYEFYLFYTIFKNEHLFSQFPKKYIDSQGNLFEQFTWVEALPEGTYTIEIRAVRFENPINRFPAAGTAAGGFTYRGIRDIDNKDELESQYNKIKNVMPEKSIIVTIKKHKTIIANVENFWSSGLITTLKSEFDISVNNTPIYDEDAFNQFLRFEKEQKELSYNKYDKFIFLN